MDGTTNLAEIAMPSAVAGVVVTVHVVRDRAHRASDLVIAAAKSEAGDALGLAGFVGRSLSDVLPSAAGLVERLDTAGRNPIELRAEGDASEQGHRLTALPACEDDVWTVTVDPLPAEQAADARLRELNHRVLNSLAMLASIIGIESRALADEAGRAALERVRSRLVAVSNLYRIVSATDSGTRIRADAYLQSVADAVSASVGLGERVAVSVHAAPRELTTSQAASVGLITNEAMTNAYKHAFSARQSGRITVALEAEGDELLLSVTDNGRGMAPDARSGLGTTLMDAMAVDLSGKVSVTSGDWGTCVRLSFPLTD